MTSPDISISSNSMHAYTCLPPLHDFLEVYLAFENFFLNSSLGMSVLSTATLFSRSLKSHLRSAAYFSRFSDWQVCSPVGEYA